VGVAWADNRQKDIYFQSYTASGKPQLSHAVNVSGSPKTFSWLPRVLGSHHGKQVFMLWQEIVFSGGTHGGEIFFARSVDAGRTFEPPLNLSQTRAGAGKGRLTQERWHNGSLDLAQGPGGQLYAAWTEYEGALRFSRSEDGGRSFSPSWHVAGDARQPARGPTLAVSRSGTIYLAWALGEAAPAGIRMAHSKDGGQSFAEPQTVSDGNGHCDAPSLAVSDATVHLVYAESSTGMFGQYHVRYTRKAAKDAFSPSRRLSVAGSDRTGASFPSVAVDAQKGVSVLWEHYPDFRERPRGLGMSVSVDGGNSFAAPSLVPGTAAPELGFNGSQQGLLTPKLAVAADGKLAIVNSRFDPGHASVIRLIRGQLR
jgi:hypothetical protein